MMLSLFPVNTTFFKLQINDAELSKLPDVDDKVRSEIDLSLSKMERVIMQHISETSDRVQLHAAMKHLVVAGNVLVYQGKKSLKLWFVENSVPFTIVVEVNPVLISRIARRVLENVDQTTTFFSRAFGGNPVSDGFEAAFLENTIGVLAEAFFQMMEPIFIGGVDAELVNWSIQ